jgi:hypothetical protein
MVREDMKRIEKTNKFDKLIRECHSWDDFVGKAEALPNTVSFGNLFERLTQLYLLTQPEYQTKLKNVWLLSEVPANVSPDCASLRPSSMVPELT